MINKSNVYFPLNKSVSNESVKSVNGKIGDVELNSSDVNALPNTTKLSDLSNDVGYITEYTETDPTVPSWAKTPDKPNYNFNEITNKPTTLSGYGITDSATATQGMKADTAIQAIEKGAPSGVATLNSNGKLISSQLDTSSNTYKIGLLNLSEEVQTAMAGTAPVISSVTDGSLTTEKYANDSITNFKISSKLQKTIENSMENIIDISTVEDGYYYNNSGVRTANSGISNVTNIRVIPGKTYTISKFGNPSTLTSRGCFYQANGTFIEAFPTTSLNGETIITAPANASYCNVNFGLTYKNLVTMTKNDGTFSVSKIPTLGAFNTDYLIDGDLNLYDESKAISGGYYNGSGVWTANASFVSTHLIPVKSGEEYVMSQMAVTLTWWDSNENFVSSLGSDIVSKSRYITVPEGVSYMRYEFGINVRYKIIFKNKDFPNIFKKIHWNLYNFENEQLGGSYNGSGTWVPASVLKTSAYIPVTPGLKYLPSMLTLAGSFGQLVTFWDANKTLIQATSIYGAVTAPANSAYACFTFSLNDKFPAIIQGESLPDLFTPKRITSPNLLLSNDNLKDGSITTSKIIDSNITSPKILDNAITSSKIADNSVTTSKISDNNITTIKIADNNITTPKIADNSITSAKLDSTLLIDLNGWNNKNWVSYGDSMTARNGWQPYVVSKFNLIHTKLGIGSTKIAGTSNVSLPCMWEDVRINAVKAANPDVITIMGGNNDWALGIGIGTDSEFELALENKDKTKFKGAYSYIIETLLTWKPTLRIFLMTTPFGTNTNTEKHEPTNATTALTIRDFSKATEEVAKYYGLPCIDIRGEAGVNGFSRSAYISDNVHCTEAGWKRMAEVVIGRLKLFNPIS